MRLTIVQRGDEWAAFEGTASDGREVMRRDSKRSLVTWAKRQVDGGQYTEARIYTGGGELDDVYETRTRTQINSIDDLERGDKIRGAKGGVQGSKWVVVEPGEYEARLQRLDKGRRRDQYRVIGQSDFHKFEVSATPSDTRRSWSDYEKEGGYRLM